MAESQPELTRNRLSGAPAVRIHVGLVLCLAICLSAGIFELTRALGGNALSWAYVFEWPLFAGFGTYMWWKLLHPDELRARGPHPTTSNDEPEPGEDLAAWNAYLAELDADDRRKGA